MDIGGFLRDARQARGLTLQQVSQQTKIPAGVLDHIEHNRFDKLPGAVFTKGYLRAFSASVGVDGERAVQEYARQSAPAPPPVDPPLVARLDVPLRVPQIALRLPQALRMPQLALRVPQIALRVPQVPLRVPRRIQVAGLSLLTLAIAGYLVSHMARRSVDTPEVVTDVPPPVATTGSAPPPPPARTFEWPAQMDMEFTANCWVAATVDGQRAVYRLVRRGERVSVIVNNEVLLRVGDPTVFAYSLNGLAGQPLGRPGMPATVRITRETYRDFLQNPPDAIE